MSGIARSLESQIDRLNAKILNIMNSTAHSHKDSDIQLPLHLSPRPKNQEKKNFAAKKSVFPVNETLLTQFSQVSMKLEDIRSQSFREFKRNDFLPDLMSFSSTSSQADLEGKEIHIHELYKLEKKVKKIINMVESGETFSGSLKFCGAHFCFHVFGMELGNKDKLLELMFPEECQWTVQKELMSNELVQLRKEVALSDKITEKFLSSVEKSMWDSFEKFEFTENKNIIRKVNEFDWKSWALVQVNYDKLKDHHKKCEVFNKRLEWQNAETQALNNYLKEKSKAVLIKEGELNFRIEELSKSHASFQESLKILSQKEQNLKSEQLHLEESKKKLEKMKIIINSKIDELNKNLEQKRTSCTSRVTDSLPTQKTLKNSSFFVSDSSSESSQNFEISKDSQEDLNQLKLSSKALNSQIYPSKPMKYPQKSCNHSVISRKNTMNASVKTSDLYCETPKKFPFRASMRIVRDPNSSLVYSKSLAMREQRVTEKEAEIEVREKEIQDHWKKNPYAQEFIPMIQNEMLRLRSMQEVYDFKLQELERKIEEEEEMENDFELQKANESLASQEISVQAEKLKDLYSMMEEMFL